MVTNIIHCDCKSTIGCPKCKGFLGRDVCGIDQHKSSPCIKKTRSQTSMTFNAILKVFLTPCSFSVGKEKLINIRKPLLEKTWRETNNRKILAPLSFKQNTDNIIAGNLDMNRKRKSDVDKIWKPLTKRMKLDNNEVNSTNSRNFVARKFIPNSLVLRRECLYRKSFVKLFDVVQEIPLEKQTEKTPDQNGFAGFLQLRSNEQSTHTKITLDVKSNHPVKLASHPNIPFSSDYGRQLLARERHCLPLDVALRKIERTEWYLKEPTVFSKNHYAPEIVFDKKVKHVHLYKFPKRQFSQKHMSLKQAFLLYAIKPVCVEIERTNITKYLVKKMEDDTTSASVVINDVKEDNSYLFTDSVSPCQINEVLSDEQTMCIKTKLKLLCNDLNLVNKDNNKNLRRSGRFHKI